MKKTIIATAIIFSLAMVLSGADIFQKFIPRSVCMFQNKTLICTHIISDAVTFIAYIGIGSLLAVLWVALKKKGFPFTDFFWQFGGFLILAGIAHLIAVLNIFVAYYWIDGIFKLATAWFSILTFISLIRSFNDIKDLPTPQECERLRLKLDEALKKLNVQDTTGDNA